jgi:hypothetical protein
MSFKDKIFNNQSPWGSDPSGNGSGKTNQPPNLDEIIANIQKKLISFSQVENLVEANLFF